MNSVTKNVASHISPEDNALLDAFMHETGAFEASDSTSTLPQTVSPESLLAVLKDAKALVLSLRSQQEPTTQVADITSRLAHVEAEVNDLKSIIADFVTK